MASFLRLGGSDFCDSIEGTAEIPSRTDRADAEGASRKPIQSVDR